jgi:Meckel syndrome type 1 protein
VPAGSAGPVLAAPTQAGKETGGFAELFAAAVQPITTTLPAMPGVPARQAGVPAAAPIAAAASSLPDMVVASGKTLPVDPAMPSGTPSPVPAGPAAVLVPAAPAMPETVATAVTRMVGDRPHGAQPAAHEEGEDQEDTDEQRDAGAALQDEALPPGTVVVPQSLVAAGLPKAIDKPERAAPPRRAETFAPTLRAPVGAAQTATASGQPDKPQMALPASPAMQVLALTPQASPAPTPPGTALPSTATLVAARAEGPLPRLVQPEARPAPDMEPVAVERHAGVAEREAPPPQAGIVPVVQPDASAVMQAPASAPLATQPLASTQGAAMAVPGTQVAALVEAVARARESGAAAGATLAHAAFGKVSLQFHHEDDGLSVTLASADPGFAPAVLAASRVPAAEPAPVQAQPPSSASPGSDLSARAQSQDQAQSQGQSQSEQQPRRGDLRQTAAPTARQSNVGDDEAPADRGIFA